MTFSIHFLRAAKLGIRLYLPKQFVWKASRLTEYCSIISFKFDTTTNPGKMNRLFVTLFFSLSIFTASSQRIYFIYLQTDPQQPFFVKMDEKLFSSSASGYLVLPRLKDSTYLFSVGFNGGGEYKFACTVNKKDHGYLIKNFGEKGWGLYDLQTSAVQMAVTDVRKDAATVNTPVNAFTELLSKAADDSTLKQKVVLPVEEKKPEVVAVAKTENAVDSNAFKTTQQKPVANEPPASNNSTANSATAITAKEEPKKEVIKIADTAIAKKTQTDAGTGESKVITPPVVANTVSQKEEPKKIAEDKVANTSIKETIAQPTDIYAKSKVVRKSESSTTDGFGLTFIDIYADGKQDTVSLVIPNDNSVKLSDTRPSDVAATESKPEPVAEKESTKTITKNVCKAIATDDDFFKLRKKMAAVKSDNAMVQEAQKVFKSKCLTTSQLKNLGALFIGDGGKYQFFDAAYTHVSDIENYSVLASEFKDGYFINRFKAMLR